MDELQQCALLRLIRRLAEEDSVQSSLQIPLQRKHAMQSFNHFISL